MLARFLRMTFPRSLKKELYVGLIYDELLLNLQDCFMQETCGRKDPG